MRSWIFRHRLRLRAIYAPRPALLPAPRARPDRRVGGGFVVVERLGPHTVLRVCLKTNHRDRRKPAA